MSIFKRHAIVMLFLSALAAGAVQASDGQTHHLSDGSGSRAKSAYHWDEQANQQGFVVAYPNGIAQESGRSQLFNAA